MKLWTKNFTIITLGSVVSMIGNAVSGFAIGVLVLDISGSVFLYSLFLISYNLPKLVMPVLSGAYLDNFSRRKVIYTLDFTSSAIFFTLFWIMKAGFFNYWLLIASTFIIGSIDSVYEVAYSSFYPSLISEGNFTKAYSIESLIFPLAQFTVPVAAFFYNKVGIAPMFLFNSFSFLIAALFETQIKTQETHVKGAYQKINFSVFKKLLGEGLEYIKKEKGLMVITAYFFVSAFCYGITDTVLLPFFKSTPYLGIMMYSVVTSIGVGGRFIGGLLQYRIKYPAAKKFAIAICVYVITAIIEGTWLFAPLPLMIVLSMTSGILGVTSYNIRISATQNYVDDKYRARFNGTFQMIFFSGSILGTLASGAATKLVAYRSLELVGMVINLSAIALIIWRGRSYAKDIYNRDI